jgi:hypothetical protein
MLSNRPVILLLAVLCSVAAAADGWHDIYHDAPLDLRLNSDRQRYAVGDTFRIQLAATNSSDRTVLLRRDWREQLVLYHIHPTTGEQVEWPGRVRIATQVDSTDVVSLKPGESFEFERPVRIFIDEDVAQFDFRVKLVGPKDLHGRHAMWQGHVWSNPIKVVVTAKQ